MQKTDQKVHGKIPANISRFLDSPANIITNVYRVDNYHDYPPFYQFATDYLPIDADISANGISRDRNTAYVKAVMETLERWYLYKLDRIKLVYDSYANMAKKKINIYDPEKLRAFSKTQLKSKRLNKYKFDRESKFFWLSVNQLSSASEIFLPAQLIYFLPRDFKKEPVLRIPDTLGAAAGVSVKQALCNGMCELIERDAYAIAYHNKIPFKKICPESINSQRILSLIKSINIYGLEVYIYELTQDIKVPVFLSLLIDKSKKGPQVSLGVKCTDSWEEALEGAILENLQNLNLLRDLYILKKSVSPLDFKKIIMGKNNPVFTRMSFWLDDNALHHLNFLVNSSCQKLSFGKPSPKLTLDEKVTLIINSLHEAGIDDIFWTQTSPKGLNKYDIFCVKAVIPQLQTIPIGMEPPYLGMKRLYTVPVQLGIMAKPLMERNINTFPHPFP